MKVNKMVEYETGEGKTEEKNAYELCEEADKLLKSAGYDMFARENGEVNSEQIRFDNRRTTRRDH